MPQTFKWDPIISVPLFFVLSVKQSYPQVKSSWSKWALAGFQSMENKQQ